MVDLLEAGFTIIDGEVEVSAGVRGGSAGVVGEGGLLELEDGDGEVAGGGASGGTFTEIGLLTGGEEEKEEKKREE